MARKKLVSKASVEKLNDEQVVLEIIEDSSAEENETPDPPVPVPPAPVAPPTCKADKKKRVLSEEQKAKMKAGREKKKALKAAPVKEVPKPEPSVPPSSNEDDMPRWFKNYLSTQKKPEPEPEVKIVAPVVKAKRGRPAGKKDTKPRTKKTATPVTPAPEPTKHSIRFI
tara:strand:+ start:325 stop:831 length:507 start_codon:yes stop_codon:yes gene_type:complete